MKWHSGEGQGDNGLIRPEMGLGEVEEGRVLSYRPKGLFGRGYASHGLGGILTLLSRRPRLAPELRNELPEERAIRNATSS